MVLGYVRVGYEALCRWFNGVLSGFSIIRQNCMIKLIKGVIRMITMLGGGSRRLQQLGYELDGGEPTLEDNFSFWLGSKGF